MSYFLNYIKSPGGGLVYLDIPDAPAFGTTTTINPTDSTITTADLGGNTDLILGAGEHVGDITLSGLVGTEGTPIRVKGAGGTANPTTTEISGMLKIWSSCEWIEIYDLFTSAIGGVKMESNSENVLLQNVVVDCEEDVSSFAGFLSKTDDGGGSVTPYKNTLRYCNFKNTDGEGIYMGQTNGVLFHNISLGKVEHCWGINFGWDCIQFAHVVEVDVDNLTFLDGGRLDASGQNRVLQLTDSAGDVRNSIITSTGTTGAVYCLFSKSDSMTIKNCYLGGEEEAFIGTGVGEVWEGASTIKANGDYVIDSCILNISSSSSTQAFQVGLDYANVVVKNCLILNTRSVLFSDGRSDTTTYSLIDGGGNQFVSSSHASMNPTFDSNQRITSAYHYNRGMGARTPTSGKYPTLSSVSISGTEETGETLTATPSGAAAGGGSSVDSYLYQWYRSDDASGTNRARIQSSAQSSTYVLVSADIGKFLDVECQAVNNLDLASDAATSAKTGAIVDSFPAIYTTIDPEELFMLGDYDGTNPWTNTGSEADVTLTPDSAEEPTVGGDGEAVFDGSQGFTGALSSAWPTSGGWTSWGKFKVDSFTENKWIYEFSNNKQLEVVASGTTLRPKSTDGFAAGTTGTVSSATEYNFWITHDDSSTMTIRVEENDGTVVINSETDTYNNNNPTATNVTVGQDLESTNRLIGSIWELGFKKGVVSGANLTSLMTHLKGL